MLLPGSLEGLGWYTHEVARRLVERHPDWTFHFLFDRPFDPAFVFGPNVVPHALFPPARHPWLWQAWFEHRLPRFFRRARPDVFLSPDGHLSLRGRVPTALVLHDLAYLHVPDMVPTRVLRYYRRFVPRFARRADRLLTVSDFSRQDMARQFGLPATAIRVTGNGARPGFRRLDAAARTAVRGAYSGGAPYFLYVGSVHPRKNLARLLAAFDRFVTETGAPTRLLIAGAAGWQTGTVRAAWQTARHRESIQFLGYVREEELPRLLGAAEALCYVSLFEGFGLPMLEAMHAEVPILAARASALPEVAGDAALLVDPHAVGDIAAGMARLHREEALRERLVAAGRAQRQKFSWDRVTDVVEAALLELAGRPAS